MRAAIIVILALALGGPASAAWAQERIPLAVMDLSGQSVDSAAAGALTTEVSNTLSRLRVFRVITREDIKRMLQLEETRQQCSGDADASCMAEIGGALGVDYLVYGSIARIAGTYNLSLVLLDIARAEAANRVSRKITDPRELLGQTEAATKLLVRPLLADKKGFLVVNVEEPGAQVTVDGRLVGVTPLPGRLELSMGAHEVLVEKSGFLTFARTIDVAPNQASVETVTLVPSDAFIEDYRAQAVAMRTAAWTTAGSGAALLVAGAILRMVGDARFDDLVNKGYLTQQASICMAQNPNYNGSDFCATPAGNANDALGTLDSIETQDTVALGLLIGGGVSVVVSTVLFVVGEDPARYEVYGTAGASPSARLQWGPRGGAFALTF